MAKFTSSDEPQVHGACTGGDCLTASTWKSCAVGYQTLVVERRHQLPQKLQRMRVVEKIVWPDPLPVDLFAEFGWLLGDVPVRSTPPRTVQFNTKLSQLKAHSPYKSQTKQAKVIVSPQQRAARIVRKLALDHLNYDMDRDCDLGQKRKKRTRPTVDACAHGAFDLQTWLQEANDNICAPKSSSSVDNNGKPASPELLLTEKATSSSPNAPKKGKTSPKHRKTSPKRDASVLVAEDSDDDNDDGVEYEKPFAQLDPKNLWEMQHHEKAKKLEQIKKSKQFQLARWLTKRMKERSYSKEIQTRLTAALTANTGQGLWRDQVASQIACELNADNVFGGGSEGNALPFATNAAELYDGIEKEWVLEKARDIKELANQEYAQGHYSQAYSILQDGAKLMTSNERGTKSSWGFNYSMDTHSKATTIQKVYHKRFRRRTACALQLQTKWRGYHAHHNYLKLQWQRYESAKYIQKWWHDHTADKEQMRLRLQTAMRGKLARLHVKRMRQSIKTLRFWIRIWVLKAIVRIRARKALRAAILIQRRVRGFLARKFVLLLREQIQKEEDKRYKLEQEYIARQLTIKLSDFEQYLSKAGQRHISALVKRLKADEARRKEERVHFTAEELHRARLLDLFQSYDVDKSGSIDIDELKELFEELCIPIDRTELENALAEMDVSQNGAIEFDEFFNYIESPTKRKSGPNALWLLKMKLTVKHFVNLFTSSTYKNHAKRLLLHQEKERLTIVLRKEFRSQQAPRFECQYCGQPFCFYRPWYYHLKKRDCREAGSAESSRTPLTEDELFLLDEEALVRARLLQVERDVLTYLETKPGTQLLKSEAKRIDRLHKSFWQLHRNKSVKKLVMDSNFIKYFFQAIDVNEINAIDRQEFCYVMQEIGITLSKKALSKCFQSINTMQTDFISFEEFCPWVQKAHELFTWKSQLKQILTRLVSFAMKYQRRKYQSQRCIVEREKYLAEVQVRQAFRAEHPPAVVCIKCNQAYWHQEKGRFHLEDDRYHELKAAWKSRCAERIHLLPSTTSILQEAAQVYKEAEKHQIEKKARQYVRRKEGRRVVRDVYNHIVSKVMALPANSKRKHKLTNLLFFQLDRQGTIGIESLRYVLDILEYQTDKEYLDELLAQLDPNQTGFINHDDFGKWAQANKANEKSTGLIEDALKLILLKIRVYRLALHIAKLRYKQALSGQLEQLTPSISSQADIDAFMLSHIGQQAVLDEAAYISTVEPSFPDKLSNVDQLKRYATFLFQLFDFQKTNKIATRDLKSILGFFYHPNDAKTIDIALTMLDPESSGQVSLEKFLSWCGPNIKPRGLKYLVHRQRIISHGVFQRKYRYRLAKAVVAAQYRHPTAAVRETQVESSNQLLVAKSEQYCISSLGKKAVAAEIIALKALERDFNVATKGKSKLQTRHAKASFLFRLFDQGHPGAIEIQDLPTILRHLPHPFDPQKLQRIVQQLSQDDHISEGTFHRWLDANFVREPRQSILDRKRKALAVAVVSFRYRKSLESSRQPVISLDLVARSDAYCKSLLGQQAIDEEETHIKALYAQFVRETTLATKRERAQAYAVFLFHLFDVDNSGAIDTTELSALLGFLSHPNDLASVHVILRAMNIAGSSPRVTETNFTTWYARELDHAQPTSVIFHQKLRQLNQPMQVRAIAQEIVAFRYRQDLLSALRTPNFF